MDDFIIYLKLGFFHVLDWKAYDHILFLIVLAVVFTLYDWKKVLWLITWFTIGHTMTLGLSAYKILNIDIEIVEFLIPVTILVTALTNIFSSKNEQQKNANINLFYAFFFGLIHGLGFSNYFSMMVEDTEAKMLPLLSFALGIEFVQIIVVLIILIFGYVAQNMIKISKRDWVLVISSIVIGITIPMLVERKLW